MKYSIAYFLYYFVILSEIKSEALPDYCKHESSYICEGLKHVGCAQNEHLFHKWTSSRQKYRPITMTSEYVTILIDKLNSAKNRVAGGELLAKGFQSAADMPIMQWNAELEFLSSHSVTKQTLNETACVSWGPEDQIKPTFILKFERSTNGNENEQFFVKYAAEFLGNYTTEKQSVSWYSTYFAYARNFGCALGEYEVERVDDVYKVKILHCLFDVPLEDLVTYTTGVPCTACPNQGKCDSVFRNLCAAI